MPKITDNVLNSVFFLYATRQDALEGKNPGGSGFFLETGQNIQTGGGHHVYEPGGNSIAVWTILAVSFCRRSGSDCL
jgi:hypothetical protein